MKKYIYIITVLFSVALVAQTEPTPLPQDNTIDFCKTSAISSKLTHLETIRGLDHTNDIFQLKLYIHVLRRETEPKRGQSIEGVNRLLQTLYNDYDPLGVHFVWDGDIDYIDNNDYYTFPNFYTNEIFNTNNHQDGIDIYIFDDLDPFKSFGLANGIAESTELMLGGYFFGYELVPLSFLKIISHEMGHVLYLWHTHHGTFDEGGGGCPELVDGSNGTTCGDFISDTPADPNIFFWNTNHLTCEFEPELWDVGQFYDEIPPVDANGQAYQPNASNLMSYTYPSCMDDFTFGQKKRMKNAIWYLPVLNQTLLDNYIYIRPNTDCFSCNGEYKFFTVYSNYPIEQLYPISSDNVIAEITEQGTGYFKVRVTNLIGSCEGERGHFSIVRAGHGIIEATQYLWVGKPKTIIDSNLTGSETASSNSGVGHVLENRIEGVVNYGWELPIPNEELFVNQTLNPEIWQHWHYDKYYRFSSAYAGNQTGLVRPYGVNPCGEGSSGNFNEICVVNSDDPEGDTDCDSSSPTIVYYPNPASSLLDIDLSLQDYKIYTVVIYDEYQTVKYSDQTTNIVKTVDVFNLVNGTYYLHIYDDNGDNILSKILIINH